MLFLWGSNRVRKPIRNIGYSFCDQCGAQQPCSARLDYTVRHFQVVFRFVTGKEYTGFCDICRARLGLLDPRVVERKLKRNPIPLLNRWGWAFAMAALAGVIAWVIDEERQAADNTTAYLAAPRVGDIYAISDDRLVAMACMSCRYGAAKVVSVEANGVYVRETKFSWNDFAAPSDEKYYSDQREFVSLSQLRDMKARGTIIRAVREVP